MAFTETQTTREMSAPLAAKFGPYGGQFVPEMLMPAVAELEHAYREAQADSAFQAEYARLLRDYVGRPTPLSYAARLSAELGGAQIYLKREDLAHTGAHKINNALGQALLAQRMGKRRIVAETGAGQHGVASGHRRRAARAGVRRLHGHGGYGPPAAQRAAHAPAGRGGAPGGKRQPHAQGRHQRGHPRLGDERARHPLPARLGARPAPLPDHGARFPGGHRASRRARRSSNRPAACRMPAWPAWAAARTRLACSTPSARTAPCS